MSYALEAEPAPMLDAFATDALRARATVCGQAYSCLRDGAGGHQWHADTHPDAVRGCRLDALSAAAAAVDERCAPPADAPAACRRPEPCLRDEEGLLHCLSSRESTAMPTIMDGAWQCDAAQPTPATHEKLGPDYHTGGLSGVVLRPKTPPPASEPPPARDAPAAAPVAAPPAAEGEQWLRCDWFQGRTRAACAADADCPLGDGAFDAWFDAVNERAPAGSTSVPAFLKAAAEDATKVELRYDAAAPAAKDGAKLRRATLRARLEGLYRDDPAFRESVDGALRAEPRVAQEAARRRAGACVAGACRAGPAPAPSVALYDGTAPVAFQQRADGGLAYSRAGRVRDVPAEACDGTAAPAECRDPTVPAAPLAAGAPTLVPGEARVAPGYRVEFADGGQFYVRNAVQVYGTLDAQAAREGCAAALCELNAATCPAPHCRRDGDACVPAPDKVADVRLR